MNLNVTIPFACQMTKNAIVRHLFRLTLLIFFWQTLIHISFNRNFDELSGVRDCRDASDESNCPSPAPGKIFLFPLSSIAQLTLM